MNNNIEKIIRGCLLIIPIILIFYGLDYFTHEIIPSFGVPDYYFKNKIIFGVIWGVIAYLFVRKLPILKRSLIISAVVAVTLQIRYYLEGYPLGFVLIFLVLHFIMLLLASLLVFLFIRKFSDKSKYKP